MRIVAPWYSPVLPNGVVDEKCAVEKALDFGGVKTGNRRLATVGKPTTKARPQANFANAYWEVVKADKTPGSQ